MAAEMYLPVLVIRLKYHGININRIPGNDSRITCFIASRILLPL